MQIFQNYSLKKLNTFGLNVSAKYFTEISSTDDLQNLLNDKNYQKENKLILGGGSNVLFKSDFNGLVIHNKIKGIVYEYLNSEEVLVTAGGGVNWHDLVLECVEKNFGGIENLSLIPGTVGAAPIQNIGAYGQELKDVFSNLKGILFKNSDEVVMLKDDCNFGYRDSIFKRVLKEKIIITSVSLKLNTRPELNLDYGNVRAELEKLNLQKITVKNVSETICNIRSSKLPDPVKYGNAGSFFKNPEIPAEQFENLKTQFSEIIGYPAPDKKIKIPAGWLIEKTGWKGKRIGNVGTFPKQALVIVNYSDASGEEIIHYAEQVRKAVYDKFKIWLEAEVNIV